MDSSRSLSSLGSILRNLEPANATFHGVSSTLAQSAVADLMKIRTDRWSFLAEASKGISDLMKLRTDHLSAFGEASKGIADLIKSRTDHLPVFAGVSKGLDDLMRLRKPWHDADLAMKEHAERLRSLMRPSVELAQQLSHKLGMLDVGLATRDLFQASRFTALADSRFGECLGGALRGLPDLKLAPAVADFSRIAGHYSTFLARCETARPLSPSVLAIPAREYFLSGETCIELPDDAAVEDETESVCATVREEARLHVFCTVEEALSALDAKLLSLWHGAVQAALSDNPDKVRHAITSLRELFTQVLHRLAPDTDVFKWSNDAKHFCKNGRPTRAARLHYIFTGLDHEPFTEFVGRDIDSLLTLIEAFQSGTHKPSQELPIRSMRLVFHRAGSTLCSLIEARLATN